MDVWDYELLRRFDRVVLSYYFRPFLNDLHSLKRAIWFVLSIFRLALSINRLFLHLNDTKFAQVFKEIKCRALPRLLKQSLIG
jgi:hypothetical protein